MVVVLRVLPAGGVRREGCLPCALWLVLENCGNLFQVLALGQDAAGEGVQFVFDALVVAVQI